MAKEIVFNKLIIDIENDEFKRGVLLYKLKINGITEREQKSISIKNIDFPKLHLADIIKKIIITTKKQEGINA